MSGGSTANQSAECHLLGGFFASFVQACLGVLCIGALIIKRHNEVPKRDWYVWFLDVTKQGIGASFGHFANIFLSMIIASVLGHADECQWYSLTFVVDSTIGTVFNICLLRLFETWMQRYPQCTMMNMGDYGDPPQLMIYVPQLLVWLLIVVFVKALTLSAMMPCLDQLNSVVRYLFRVFKGEPEMELVVVMIIIPTVFNTLQFWITDTFLMNHAEALNEPVEDGRLRTAGRMLGDVRARFRRGGAGNSSSNSISRYNHHERLSSVDPDEGLQLGSALDVMERSYDKRIVGGIIPNSHSHSNGGTSGNATGSGSNSKLSYNAVSGASVTAQYQQLQPIVSNGKTPLLPPSNSIHSSSSGADGNTSPMYYEASEYDNSSNRSTTATASAGQIFNQLLVRSGLSHWWAKSSTGGLHPRTNSETDLMAHERELTHNNNSSPQCVGGSNGIGSGSGGKIGPWSAAATTVRAGAGSSSSISSSSATFSPLRRNKESEQQLPNSTGAAAIKSATGTSLRKTVSSSADAADSNKSVIL